MANWYSKYLDIYNKPFSEVPQNILDLIREGLSALQSSNPLVSIVVIAYNEENRLTACLWSLSNLQTSYPIEILGVNNNSKDKTENIYKELGVPYYNESKQSPGFARQCGLEHAKGKYHFFIDADTLYPSCYIDRMMEKLMKPDVSCVGTFWSYYPDNKHSSLGLFWFELLRDTFLWVQHFKRPELCIRGMTFAFNANYAKQVKIRTDIRRGEDGSLALSLKKYGKIDFLYCREVRPITGYGTLNESSLFHSLLNRVRIQLKGISRIFYKTDHYNDSEDNMVKMSKIKVLEVIRQGQIGGGESHLLDLVSFMDKERFEPVCLSFTAGEMINRLEAMNIRCHVIPTEKPFDIKVQKRIIQLIEDEDIQIVHAHGSRAASNILYPARHLHKPIIYTVHGWSFHDDQSLPVRLLRRWSEKLICNFSDKVICVSQSNADTGRQRFGLSDAIVIENGINLVKFNPDGKFNDLRKVFGFEEDDFVAGFIARCTKQKAPLDFLQAVCLAHQKNNKVKGLFVGEGDMDDEVDAMISEYNMGDYVFRSKFRTDVPDLLHCINVYCLPSLWEGLSIALLEAMAMGKAIIATPTDGTKEVIKRDQNGLVIPFEQPQALADAIIRFLEDEDLYKKCCSQARQIVEQRFNAQRVSDAVAEIYQSYHI